EVNGARGVHRSFISAELPSPPPTIGRGEKMNTRTRVLCTLAIGGGLLGLASLAQAAAARDHAPTCPSFSSSNFHHSTRINNRYSPLTAGDLYTYNGNVKRQPVTETVYVTYNTPMIDGVRTVEVRDRVYESGVLTEDTLDWYA